MEEFPTAFLCCPGVDPKLVPDGWVMNHYRWIVWVVDSLERRLGRQVLTPTSIMDRLKYRYDREVDRGESSILRKVIEKYKSAAVPMVLCVGWREGVVKYRVWGGASGDIVWLLGMLTRQQVKALLGGGKDGEA